MRLFLMLVWHPAFGAAVDPVGVLGVDERPVAVPKTYTAWTPMTYDRAAPWRRRLATPPTPSQIELWLEEDNALALEEIEAPNGGRLPDAADAALDTVLATVVPLLGR
ncbi:hypothetical protein [Actinomadura sp. 3N407]|uniref:hypothetical protein n=1 Tax=Actinomadura sp. 3N407 TaxID=3457423 RepID=UPI003FCCDA8F